MVTEKSEYSFSSTPPAESTIMLRIGILLLSIASASGFAAGRSNGVSVIDASEQSIQIEFTPQYRPVQTQEANGTTFVEYDFIGSIPRTSRRDEGSPDLRSYAIPLGFKSTGGNVVRVVAADYEEIPNVLLRPVPALGIQDEMVTAKEYAINNETYRQNRFLPGDVASLSSVDRVRSMFIGTLELFPLQYNPATRTLRRYRRIVVEVVYGASPASRIQTNDDALFEGALVNFQHARNWKYGAAPGLMRLTGQPSVLSQGTWYRLTVGEEGIYLLDAGWFSRNGISLAGVNPQTLEIYGNGGEELSESVTLPGPVDLVENAIHVEGEADGRWDAGDYLLFYGRGVQGVKYDPASRTLRHYIHHYSRANYYWLRFGVRNGKRMGQQISSAAAPNVTPTSFSDCVFVEPDTFNIVKSGKDWVSLPVTPGGRIVRTLPLHGLVASEPRTYRYTLVAGSYELPMFTVQETGVEIGRHYLGTIVSGGYLFANAETFEAYGAFPVSNNTSQLSFSFSSAHAGAIGCLDWIEIHYRRTFDPVNNVLRFRSPDTTGVVEYRLGQFAGAVAVFNVTDYANVKRVAATSGAFRSAEQAGTPSEYCAASAGGYKTPIAVTTVANQNLRGVTQQVDFIILTTQDFMAAANRLKAHREQARYGNLRTLIVDVNAVYNEFSGGVPDVTAIRDYLKYAYENYGTPAARPQFVLFLGQGSYDYKGITGKSNYVPTWESAESYDEVRSTATDDFFTRFSPSTKPWMVSGRINSRTVSEADLVVNKIIGYDTRSARGTWKMRGMFVGDDGNEEGSVYTVGAETVAELYTPDILEKVKIYTEEYPLQIATQGRRRPQAYQAIIDEMNRGVLFVNFTGHGNPTVWTHESVFSVATSIPQLTNADKLFVFFGATCSFSLFDDPTRRTGTELMMNKSDGGAVGAISAARKVYANENQYLNEGIFRNMFRTDRFGRVVVDRPAAAIFLFKQNVNNNNDEKYFYMGDPTMRLQFPERYVAIEEINQEPVDSVNGTARTAPIKLKALSRVTIKGSIRDADNQVDTTLSGRVTLVINDATRQIRIPAFNWSYKAVGGLIYRGENSATRGRFTAASIVPKDIAYADSLSRGRIVSYFSSSDEEGAGYTSKIWVGGSDQAASSDSIGPLLKITLGNSYEQSLSFRPGDVVNEKPTLFVDCVDSSGINTSTSGIGHRIEAWINGSAQSKDLTDYYTSKLDNYQAGTVAYPLRDLPQGPNTIRVRAWDTYNNSRAAETSFQVLTSDQLRVVEVMNFPNPFSKTTAFTFRHNQSIPVTASVKVYTLAGRLIRTVDMPFATEPFVSIPWDGRDADGDVVANGVYLYKLVVRTVDGRFTSEVLGKLAMAK